MRNLERRGGEGSADRSCRCSFLWGLAGVAVALVVGVVCPASAAPAAQPFDLSEVRLLEGPFQAAQERDKGYILRVDVERMMHWWRVNNGLAASAQPYGPWKATDYAFQGHYEGHYLSACYA